MINTNETIIKVENLHKCFKGTIHALGGVNVEIRRGEVVVIIGPSGSGKSTLLRSLNMLEEPTDGHIYFEGVDIMNPKTDINKMRQKMGMVFQQFNLFPQYTVKRNITLAEGLLAKERIKKTGSYNGYTDHREALAAIDQKAERLLEEVGLSDKRDSYPCQLSGGQQQRVAIARALAMEPDVLCFDEPTSALDPELTGEVLRVIRELKAAGRTMIIVTHEIEFARDVSDTVMFMDGGVVAEIGPPEQVIGNPQNPRTREFLTRFNER